MVALNHLFAPVLGTCMTCQREKPVGELTYKRTGEACACLYCRNKASKARPEYQERTRRNQRVLMQQRRAAGYDRDLFACKRAELRLAMLTDWDIRPLSPVEFLELAEA